MKKYLTVLLLLVLIVPSVTFASWWNPFTWKIFSFLKKKEVPPAQLINKDVIKEDSKQSTNTSESFTEQLDSNQIVPETENIEKVIPVIENKVIQTENTLEFQPPAKNSSLVDCGRGKANGVGQPQPEIDCFFFNMINNCKESKIILGKESGYHSDILISINKEKDSCLISGETTESIITCKFPPYTDLDKKELLKSSQQERFENVFMIPMGLSFSLEKKTSNCTLQQKQL